MRLDKEYAIYTQIDKQMDLKSYYLQIIFFSHYGSFFFFFGESSLTDQAKKNHFIIEISDTKKPINIRRNGVHPS